MSTFDFLPVRSDPPTRGKGSVAGCRAQVGHHRRYDREHDRSSIDDQARSSMAVVIGRSRLIDCDGSADERVTWALVGILKPCDLILAS